MRIFHVGWKGWGCTDGKTAKTDGDLMLDVLLLTLSNLLFIPAIVLSAYRKYFTEAFVYFATMASSSVRQYFYDSLFVLQFKLDFFILENMYKFGHLALNEYSKYCLQIVLLKLIYIIDKHCEEREKCINFKLIFSARQFV